MGDSMSTIINATTTNGVVIQPDNSGSLVLQTNSGTTALTIDTSQNVAFAKGFTVGATAAPTFSYYQSSAQTFSSTTVTKLTFTSNDWDTTSGMFASSRFTPTIAGYYQISGGFAMATVATGCFTLLYKNGVSFKTLFAYQNSNGNAAYGSALVYLNGSTDYVELYGFLIVGQAILTGTANTYFQAAMVRSA